MPGRNDALDRLLEGPLRRELAAALRNVRLTPDQAAAVAAGTLSADIVVQEIFDQLTPSVQAALLRAQVAAGRTAVQELKVKLVFGAENPIVTEYARSHAAKLVVELVTEQRAVLRDIIARGAAAGRNPYDLAKDIKRVVGLHSRFAGAVSRYAANLTAGGTAPAKVDKLAGAYAERLLRVRSNTIARTELMKAAETGRREAWNEAAREGLIDRAVMRRVWILAPDHDEDDECTETDRGGSVAFDDEFQYGDPPLHPNCKCTVALTDEP